VAYRCCTGIVVARIATGKSCGNYASNEEEQSPYGIDNELLKKTDRQ